MLWTIGYDTIYALQDKEDDALIGVRSTARLFGRGSRLGIAAFYVAAFVLFGIAFVLADAGVFAFAGLGAALLHAIWLIVTLDPDDPENCLKRFRANSHDRLDRLRRARRRRAHQILESRRCATQWRAMISRPSIRSRLTVPPSAGG